MKHIVILTKKMQGVRPLFPFSRQETPIQARRLALNHHRCQRQILIFIAESKSCENLTYLRKAQHQPHCSIHQVLTSSNNSTIKDKYLSLQRIQSKRGIKYHKSKAIAVVETVM
jgi:hypothetical protein